jgi:predicted nucleic acid-binding protein
MIFDTDIIIWIQRGKKKAGEIVDSDDDRCISIISYMELLQNAQNKQQQLTIMTYIKDMDFTILPLSENIGHRASIYIEEYSLSHGISADDALIASTAIENNHVLVSGNSKHYKAIHDLKFKRFQI